MMIAETGNFGVFTETTPVNDSLAYHNRPRTGFDYGTNAALYIWNNMTPAPPAARLPRAATCWSFDIAGGNWFGMGVFLPNFRNMKNYSDGYLHFDTQDHRNRVHESGNQKFPGRRILASVGSRPDLRVRVCS